MPRLASFRHRPSPAAALALHCIASSLSQAPTPPPHRSDPTKQNKQDNDALTLSDPSVAVLALAALLQALQLLVLGPRVNEAMRQRNRKEKEEGFADVRACVHACVRACVSTPRGPPIKPSIAFHLVHPPITMQVAPKASVAGKERSGELQALSKRFAKLHGLSSTGKGDLI